MIEPQMLIIIAIILPFFAAAGVNLFSAYKNVREIWQIICALGLIATIAGIYDNFTHELDAVASIINILPGIGINFEAESISIIYASIASVLWLFAIIYSAGYLRFTNDQKQSRFFIYYSLSIGASIGLAFSSNLVTSFIFYEMLTLVTFPLVIHNGDAESRAAGRTYLVYLLGSSLGLMLPAIIGVYYLSGSVDYTAGGIIYKPDINYTSLIIIFMLFLFGTAKAAVMPMHRWLPKAMVAPAPVSALLHAVAVVKAGVFFIAKVMIYIFGADNIEFASILKELVIYIAGFTIVLSAIFALKSAELKKRLAYSTISNLSYIILAFAILTENGVIAGGAHMVSHALGKITLFFVAGAIGLLFHVKYIKDCDGLGRKSPILFGCFFLCSLSLIGTPYFAGGISKELIVTAAIDDGVKWLVYLFYVMMLLSAAYLLPISLRAFFKRGEGNLTAISGGKLMKVAVIGTTALTLMYPFYAEYITKLLARVIV